jgi:hypothetical protein
LWNKVTHPAKLPLTCWREGLAAPKLWISVLTKTFAESVGRMNVSVVADEGDEDVNVSDSDSSDGESDLIDESHGVGKDDAKFLSPSIDLPQNKFPMPHSLGIRKEYQLQAIIQEIVKYNGNNQSIEFMQRNNHPGFLIVCPSSRCVGRYESELNKKNGIIDSLLSAISKIAKCNVREAAECLM